MGGILDILRAGVQPAMAIRSGQLQGRREAEQDGRSLLAQLQAQRAASERQQQMDAQQKAVQDSQIAENNARAQAALRPPSVKKESMIGEHGEVVFVDPTAEHPEQALPPGFKARIPAKPNGPDYSPEGIKSAADRAAAIAAATAPFRISATAANANPSEGERNAAALLPEIEDARERLAKYSNVSALEALKSRGGPLTNWTKTPEGRLYRQAADQYLANVIYGKSGKGITDAERQQLYSIYIGWPGDDEQTLAAKARARQLAEQGIRTSAGRAVPKSDGADFSDVQGGSQSSAPSKQALVEQMVRQGKTDAQIKAAVAAMSAGAQP